MNNLPNIGTFPPIVEAWRKFKETRIKQFPQNNLRASSVGHPCKRYHYHSIKNWQDKPLHDATLQSIFDEGNLHETAVIQELQQMGFECMHQQRPIQIDKPLITGHIDGLIRYQGKDYPFDVKTIGPWDYDKIDSAEDLLFSKKIYQRNYPAQIQLYLLMSGNEYGCFIMKNKLTGEIKPIWMQIDYDYLEPILKRAEQVYEDIKNESPSERINDFDVCGKCDFSHVCLPDIKANPNVTMIDDVELSGMLDRRSELEASAKEFKEVDERVKEQAKIGGLGEKVCGNYLLQVIERKRKKKIPIDYREEEETFQVCKIVRLEL